MKSFSVILAGLIAFAPAAIASEANKSSSKTVYLVIKSKLQGKGVSLLAIPMASAEQCEEEGVLITTSERFDLRFANQDAFECVNGK